MMPPSQLSRMPYHSIRQASGQYSRPDLILRRMTPIGYQPVGHVPSPYQPQHGGNQQMYGAQGYKSFPYTQGGLPH
jgi:hypothetical protein